MITILVRIEELRVDERCGATGVPRIRMEFDAAHAREYHCRSALRAHCPDAVSLVSPPVLVIFAYTCVLLCRKPICVLFSGPMHKSLGAGSYKYSSIIILYLLLVL